MRSTLLLVLHAGAVVCLPHAVASIDDAVQSNATHKILLRSPKGPEGGSGSGSGQENGEGKHPASPSFCQKDPKRIKPRFDTIDETCSRAAAIENILWFSTDMILQTYNHDYSRSRDSKQLQAEGWVTSVVAQDMSRLCPELEGIFPDPETLRGRSGDFEKRFPAPQVSNMGVSQQPDWETHSTYNGGNSWFVNSYSRDSRAFVIYSAQDQLWQHGIPSTRVPAQATLTTRWADIAYYDWAVSAKHAKNTFMLKPVSRGPQTIFPAPTWFLIQSAATSPDTKTVIKYCLDFWGINELPVWPKIITFPAGSYCHNLLLGTASSAEVAQFLISRRWVVGHIVFSSVTIYATSEDQKQGAPNLLWNTMRYHPKFDEMRQANAVFPFPQTPDGYPHMFKPRPGGQRA